MRKQKILFVDTLSPKAGMTISKNDALFFAPFGEKFEYSRDLIKVFDSVLKKARVKPADLEGVMVITGPGSYTSIRIAVSFANALGFAQNIPVQGVTLFDVTRHKETDMLIAEAGRGNIFFHQGNKEGILPEEDLKAKHKKVKVDLAFALDMFEDASEFLGPVSAHYIAQPNISKPKKK